MPYYPRGYLEEEARGYFLDSRERHLHTNTSAKRSHRAWRLLRVSQARGTAIADFLDDRAVLDFVDVAPHDLGLSPNPAIRERSRDRAVASAARGREDEE